MSARLVSLPFFESVNENEQRSRRTAPNKGCMPGAKEVRDLALHTIITSFRHEATALKWLHHMKSAELSCAAVSSHRSLHEKCP